MRALESKPAQAQLNVGILHEQIPQQSRTMILDHDDDRALVDRQIGFGEPVGVLAEGVGKTETAPQPVADNVHRNNVWRDLPLRAHRGS